MRARSTGPEWRKHSLLPDNVRRPVAPFRAEHLQFPQEMFETAAQAIAEQWLERFIQK